MASRGAVRCLKRDGRNNTLDYDGVTTVELEKRFQELSAIVQRARDSFSCRLEEEQQNPLKELRCRLVKAKERFHSRLANSSRFPDAGGFYPVEPENPFEELRSVLRSARINFVPLLDQYILDNSPVDSVSHDVNQKCPWTSTEQMPTFPSSKDPLRNRKPPRPSKSDKNKLTNSCDDACCNSPHRLSKEEVRDESRYKNSICTSSNTNGPAAESQSLRTTAQAAVTRGSGTIVPPLPSTFPGVETKNSRLSVTVRRSKSLQSAVPGGRWKTSELSVRASRSKSPKSTLLDAVSETPDPNVRDTGTQNLNPTELAAVSTCSHSNVPVTECSRSDPKASTLTSEIPDSSSSTKVFVSAHETSSNVNVKPRVWSSRIVAGEEILEGPLPPASPAVLASSVHRLNLLITEELDRKRGTP